MGIYYLKQLNALFSNLILISFIRYLIIFINFNNLISVNSFILPAVDNTSTLLNLTKINEKINERQLSFSELYPNLASLHQLLTSSIEYSSGQQYVHTNSPATPTDETDSSNSPATSQTPETQTIEDQLSKDKSIINIKFIKKLPRKLEIKKQRKKIDYLKDKNLNFDSAYLIEKWNNCTVKFKSLNKSKDNGELMIHNNYELQKQNYSKQIQVLIEGLDCIQLPIKQLKPYSNNITSLVISRTSIVKLEKYIFGVGGLIKLEQLYIHNNNKLVQLKTRSFDGLPFLSYLSIINNENLNELQSDAFAGIKNCEELIYIGNGIDKWSYDYFTYLIKIVSSRILPNLVHLHLSKTKCELIDEDEYEFKKMKKLYNEFFNETSKPSTNFNLNRDIKKPNFGIKINRNDLIFIEQVKYLQLEDCDLVYIQPDSFEPLLKNLVQLNLGYNKLINLNNLKQLLKTFSTTNPYLLTLINKKRNQFNKNLLLKDNQQDDQFNSQNSNQNSSPFNGHFNGHFNAFVNNQNSNQNQTNQINSLGGLETLDLSGVLTTALYIPKDLLTVISKTTIKHLYLRNLFWRELLAGDLPPLPNLQTLNLDYSFLEQIDENGVFTNCENLVSLSLKGNLLSTIPLNMLEPLVKLEKLDLSGYKSYEQDLIFYRKFTFFKKTFVFGTNLKELNLNYKNLEILERKIFIGLFKLESLELKHTNLKYVEYLVFFSLKSIIKIDLSLNPLLVYNIRLSEEDSFTGLEAIEEVNLSGCNITDQDINDQNLFKRMKENLKYLDLSNNLISKIDAQTFIDFNELRTINLSFNQIESWHTKLFTKNNFIMSLDVSHNNLKEISPEMYWGKNFYLIFISIYRLKRLAFHFNPLICSCSAIKGSILWLNNDNKQKKILNKLNNHEIQEHLESLVNRQQQIVNTVYATTADFSPKSIIDWLEYTNIEFLNEQHPLRSKSYYCHLKESYSSNLSKNLSSFNLTSIDHLNEELINNQFINNDDKTIIPLGIFVNYYCLNSLFLNGNLKFTMLIVIVSSLMLLTTFCLMIALVYNSTLRRLITMVDDDFIHHYEYDAFVSYNKNGKNNYWVLNNLVPSLEELPQSNNNQNGHNQSSKIHFSSIYQENEQYNLRTWIRNNKNKKSTIKMDEKLSDNDLKKQTNCQKIKLCVYERDFIAGKQISDCISESIRNSRKVILVVSKNFANSAWCRFETDLAHHTLIDQNRDGLILIKLEEDLNSEFLERTAPQLHFLLKTRIYLQWSQNKKEQQLFWKKLHSALGLNKSYNGTYNHLRNMYHYCTNQKQDHKRRPSVVLTPTHNGLQNYYEDDEKINSLTDKLNDNLNDNECDKLKDNEKIFNKCNLEKIEFVENVKNLKIKNESIQQQSEVDVIDYNNNNIIEINKNELNTELKNDQNIKSNEKQNNELNIKSINNNRIELRNFNYYLNNYDAHLPFYRLLFTTQNLLPDLYGKLSDKFVFFKRLVFNLVFSGFSFRS